MIQKKPKNPMFAVSDNDGSTRDRLQSLWDDCKDEVIGRLHKSTIVSIALSRITKEDILNSKIKKGE